MSSANCLDELKHANSAVDKLTKRQALRFVVTHDEGSFSYSHQCRETALSSFETEKEPPMRIGAESHHHEHSLRELRVKQELHALSVFALSDRKHLLGTVTLILHLRLLTLFTPNFDERLPQVGIGAARVTKGLIEDRFHWSP